MNNEPLTSALIDIAGKNVISGDNENISRLCKCVNYLSAQLKITASAIEQDTKAIFINAAEILKPQEASDE